jgi:uncharacterized protein YdhG (YjbR/CyaY superfamily)
MFKKPATIDEYLANVKGAQRTALDRLRQTILATVPQAEECVSYNLPAFRLGESVIAGFAATAKGCSYYPFSGSTLRTLAADLKGYSMTKGALHFDPEEGLPQALVRKLIKVRLAELKGS